MTFRRHFTGYDAGFSPMGGGSSYTEVANYASLPSAAANAGVVMVVTTATGVWMVNRREAGMYRSDGVSWTRLGNWTQAFNNNNFEIFDGSDSTKIAKFNTSNISNLTTRTYTLPDANGTLALNSQLNHDTIANTHNMTTDMDVNGLTVIAAVDGAADYIPIYDTNVGILRKVLAEDLGGGGGSSGDPDRGIRYTIMMEV